MNKTILLCIAMAFFSSLNAEDTGYYFGGSWSELDDQEYLDVEKDPGFELRIGVPISEGFAIEGGYLDFGTVTLPVTPDAGGFYDTTGYTASLVASYPFDPVPELILYLSSGYYWLKSEGAFGSIAGPVDFKERDDEFFYATGISYFLSDNVEIRGAYKDSPIFSWVSLGVNVHF